MLRGSLTGTNVVGKAIRALSDTKMPFQLFLLNQVAPDTFTMMNARSGTFLDLKNSMPLSSCFAAIFG